MDGIWFLKYRDDVGGPDGDVAKIENLRCMERDSMEKRL